MLMSPTRLSLRGSALPQRGGIVLLLLTYDCHHYVLGERRPQYAITDASDATFHFHSPGEGIECTFAPLQYHSSRSISWMLPIAPASQPRLTGTVQDLS